jgi:hypothetical protein
VVSVHSPAIRRLIADGENGFLFPNEVASWVSFLRSAPSRERLARMGRAAATAVATMGWDHTARKYFEACEELTSVAGEARAV